MMISAATPQAATASPDSEPSRRRPSERPSSPWPTGVPPYVPFPGGFR